MPFSAETKAELLRLWPEQPCCQAAEARAFLDALGWRERQEALWRFGLATAQAGLARKGYKLFKALGLAIAHRQVAPHRHELTLELPRRHPLEAPLTEPLTEGLRRCCARAYVRGLFVAHGSISSPQRAYHLEFDIHEPIVAAALLTALARLDIAAAQAPRARGVVVYLKDAEAIAALLREIGAHQALLEFENVRVVKEVRNQINRLVNAETANVDKTVQAALQQTQAVRRIAAHMGLDALPPALQRAARLRLAHPYASLRELAELAPDVTKSGISYRLRRLCRIAEALEVPTDEQENWEG